ncbi:MAG TPA: thiamine pyrophosphate-binding protein [Thermomicrobiales bacterium]|nr:thiamine pyrophosphate-binding protein [Thermomicrobiales bacterium]
MQGARALTEVLIASGVSHIFGLPGDTGVSFYDALYDRRDRVRHILTRDERSASFMADVYARVSGKLGVCEGPSGGGATYIVPGVAEAHGSAIPLLCLTSDTPVGHQGRGVLTELDQQALFAPVTKWNTRVQHPATLAEATRRAIRMATTGRPGAVHLSLPSDILEGETPDASVYGSPEFGAVPAGRVRPDASDVERAAALVKAARRPVIVAGGGVLTSGAGEALQVFAERMGIPVATSINGKGSVSEESPVSIGVVGGNGAPAYANGWVADADLVVFVGTRTDSTTTNNWTLPARDPSVRIVHIDIDAFQVGNTYRADVAVIGDAMLALLDLDEALRDTKPDDAATRRMRALALDRAAYWERVEREAGSLDRPIKPQRVIRALRDVLSEDAIIVADPGTPTPYIAAQYALRRIGRTTVIPRAHGGLGFAIPGVVGASMAAPGRQVVGLTGDGSFGMSCGEFETISRLNLPVVLLHFNNGTFGWIKQLQHLYHGDRYFSVDFNPVDYGAIARGFGLEARQVVDPEDVDGAIRDALAAGRPALLDFVTEAQMTETPPVSAWEEAERARRLVGAAPGGQH